MTLWPVNQARPENNKRRIYIQIDKEAENQSTNRFDKFEREPVDEGEVATTNIASSTPDATATTIKTEALSDLQILRTIQGSFRAAARETFEYGMDSEFITQLARQIDDHGHKAVEAIASVILKGQAKAQVIAEALRFLGSIDHEESFRLRFVLLTLSLMNPSRWVRDGASLGLDEMNDPRAIPALESAVARERLPELRKDIAIVLDRLRQPA